MNHTVHNHGNYLCSAIIIPTLTTGVDINHPILTFDDTKEVETMTLQEMAMMVLTMTLLAH